MIDLAIDLAPVTPSDRSLDETAARYDNLLSPRQVNVRTLPPFPTVAMKVGQLLRSPDYSITALEKLLSSDASIAAAVLKLANSAYYNRGLPVETVRKAVLRVGAGKLSALAVATALGRLNVRPPLRPLQRRIWVRANACALVCQTLAEFWGGDADLSFTCGLLHDLGHVAAVSLLDSELATHPEDGRFEESFWQERIDRHHLQLGVLLATEWQLPTVLIELIAHHHDVAPPPSVAKDIFRCVRLSDTIVQLIFGTPHVSADDLRQLEGLSGGIDSERIAQLVNTLPPLLAESPTEGAQASVNSDSQVRVPTLVGRSDTKLWCLVEGGAATEPFEVTSATTDCIELSGPVGLEPRSIVHLKLSPPHSIHLWAEVRTCATSSKGHRMKVHPFGLSPTAWEMWQGVVSRIVSRHHEGLDATNLRDSPRNS